MSARFDYSKYINKIEINKKKEKRRKSQSEKDKLIGRERDRDWIDISGVLVILSSIWFDDCSDYLIVVQETRSIFHRLVANSQLFNICPSLKFSHYCIYSFHITVIRFWLEWKNGEIKKRRKSWEGCPNWSAPFIADNFQCLCGSSMNRLLSLSLCASVAILGFSLGLCLSVASLSDC